MKLTKIVVLVAHEDELNVDGLTNDIDCAIAQAIEESRVNVFYEVRPQDTKEVTLGSINLSLEEGYPLEKATSPDDEPETTTKH